MNMKKITTLFMFIVITLFAFFTTNIKAYTEDFDNNLVNTGRIVSFDEGNMEVTIDVNGVGQEVFAASEVDTTTLWPGNSDDIPNKNMFVKWLPQYQKWYYDLIANQQYQQTLESIAYQNGYDQAIKDNYQEIYNRAYKIGYDAGFEKGTEYGITITQIPAYRDGYNDGYDDGKSDGYEQGMADSQVPGVLILHQINTLLFDEFNLETMKLINRVAQRKLNGTEAWDIHVIREKTIRLELPGNYFPGINIFSKDNNTARSTNGVFVQNYVPGQGSVYDRDIEGIVYSDVTKVFYLCIDKTRIPGYNDAMSSSQKLGIIKNYMSQQPIIINYKITEEEIPITELDLQMQPIWKKAFQDGEKQGYSQGREVGKNEGRKIGYDEALDMAWLRAIFTGFTAFFGVKLFGNISIGLIVGVPLFISLALWVFKLVRGD